MTEDETTYQRISRERLERIEGERLVAAVFYRPPALRLAHVLFELCLKLHGPIDAHPMHECWLGRIGMRLADRGQAVTQRWLLTPAGRRSRLWLDPVAYKSLTVRPRRR